MTRPRVAVVRLPGMNCEDETARALELSGLQAVPIAWDEEPRALLGHDAYVLPGGFSYQDRVRAGAIAAKDPRLDVLAEQAAKGVPVLGICNGAQILVEAGLVPGGTDGDVAMALATNRLERREGYYATWVVLEARPGSLWTEAYAPNERVPLPMAHGEGRFTTRKPGTLERLARDGQVPFAYVAREGEGPARGWPDNPNGAEADAAGVTNARGNVLALMPHPERADRLYHVPEDLAGPWGERRRSAHGDAAKIQGAGPGHGVFLSLAWHLGVSPRVAARAEGEPGPKGPEEEASSLDRGLNDNPRAEGEPGPKGPEGEASSLDRGVDVNTSSLDRAREPKASAGAQRPEGEASSLDRAREPKASAGAQRPEGEASSLDRAFNQTRAR